MKTSKLFLVSIILMIFTISVAGCNRNPSSSEFPATRTDLFMGTVVQIKIYESVDEAVFEEAFSLIEDIENKMSLNMPESELNQINRAAGENPVKVSGDTYDVIDKAIYYGSLSGGTFDITIGPLVSLWNIGKENARVPDQSEIDEAIKQIDYKKVLLNPDEKTVFLKDSGMILDLGGIAKGYAADALSEMFEKEGINHAIINLGGNIYALGQNPNGNPWQIGIQNPEAERSDYIGVASVKDKSVVTSGIYERFLESGGKSYHHILSPFNGYPFENSLTAVSIIASKSVDADALSTVAFSLGLESGLTLLESIPDAEAIFITKDFNVYTTSGLKDSFKMANDEFILANQEK
ncbi:MAG: FAD:protein FMN transferase [Peptostreptococcaceae bacterium]|nr:FAD:protein FMN transferase [Peptostreptococcaceae bacterium]